MEIDDDKRQSTIQTNHQSIDEQTTANVIPMQQLRSKEERQ
jgi:hypothetical protein